MVKKNGVPAWARVLTWLKSWLAGLVAAIGVGAYVLGYWFFDGYLAGYGYSMRAMPHDYAAIMMEAFLLLLNVTAVLLETPWIVPLVFFAAAIVLFSYVWLLQWLVGIVSSAKTRAQPVIRRQLEKMGRWVARRFKRTSPATSKNTGGDPARGHIFLAFFVPLFSGGAVLFVLLVVLLVLLLPVGGAHRFGVYLAQREIRHYKPCGSCDKKETQAPCILFGNTTKGVVSGIVVAGTDGLVLVYDGKIAHLIKRNDEFRGAVSVLP